MDAANPYEPPRSPLQDANVQKGPRSDGQRISICVVGLALVGFVAGWVGVGLRGQLAVPGLRGAVGGMIGAAVASVLCGGIVWILSRRVELIAFLGPGAAGIMGGAQAAREGQWSAVVICLVVIAIVGAIMGVVAYVGRSIRLSNGPTPNAPLSDTHSQLAEAVDEIAEDQG